MAGNGTGGPWGNGGNRGSGNNGGGGDRPPSSGGQGPDLDDLVRKGQEQLRVLMGGKGGDNKNASPNGGGSGIGFGGFGLILIAVFGIWVLIVFIELIPLSSQLNCFLVAITKQEMKVLILPHGQLSQKQSCQ